LHKHILKNQFPQEPAHFHQSDADPVTGAFTATIVPEATGEEDTAVFWHGMEKAAKRLEYSLNIYHRCNFEPNFFVRLAVVGGGI
jgi:hypothetical protein